MTGTIKLLLGKAVAIPIFISLCLIILVSVSSTDTLINGKSLIARTTQSTINGVNVNLCLYLASKAALFSSRHFTKFVTSGST